MHLMSSAMAQGQLAPPSVETAPQAKQKWSVQAARILEHEREKSGLSEEELLIIFSVPV